ncbi:MAG: ABC transporter permease [Planctomycetota bacterium]|nr:ABC transporter permease [Planctomycetota bacterium]
MIALALRIIAHRPMRYLVALLGISVAAGLALVQLGLYFGFKENASVVVDHTEGDVWVCARFQNNFDFPSLMTEETLNKVRATPGVQWTAPMLILFRDWKLPDGRKQTVQVVGFDAQRRGAGVPWRMVEGFPEDLSELGKVTVDATTRRKLGNPKTGDVAEINGKRVEVAGMTEGIQSFQGNPMVFCDMITARTVGGLNHDHLHYIVVGVQPGVEPVEVLNRLEALDYVEAYTSAQFSKKAQRYWLESTGAGTALFFAAMMGLVVGIVVAGQVLYTSTIEHIREYGTLKAIGATNTQVSMAIMAQAVTWALPAHLLAGVLLWVAMQKIQGKGIHLSLDAGTYAWLGLGTIVVCMAASILSVLRIMKVQPADVFKG